MIEISVTWTRFKTYFTNYPSSIFAEADTVYYHLWMERKNRIIICDLHLINDSDCVTEFETSYLSLCNKIESFIVKSQLQDNSGNGITSTVAGYTRAVDVQIRDRDGLNQLVINSDGSVNVKTVLPIPPNTIKIAYIVEGVVNGSTISDVPYIIPENTVFTLQRFKVGGAGQSGDDTRFSLFYSETSNTVNGSVIKKSNFVYNGFVSVYQEDFSEDFTGNGVRTFILRRHRANATARTIHAIIFGYLTYNTITVDESNTSTGLTSTTVTRTGAGWTINSHVGKYLRIAGGTPIYIISNTATVLTIMGYIDIITDSANNNIIVVPYEIITFNI
jgi:hypothetical protein